MKLGGRPVTDEYEKIIEEALIEGNIDYYTEGVNTNNLDFYLPEHEIYIEVKTMHTDRVYKQMDRVHECIMVQGRVACLFLGRLLIESYADDDMAFEKEIAGDN